MPVKRQDKRNRKHNSAITVKMRTNSINVGCSSISPTIIGLLREHWTTKWDSTAEKNEDIFPQIDAEERRGILKLETNFALSH